jgi:hypothetical protein
MSSRAEKVSDVIERLQKYYKPDDLLAINFWSKEDFEGYEDIEQALNIAQGYLDNINEHLTQYVMGEMEADL